MKRYALINSAQMTKQNITQWKEITDVSYISSLTNLQKWQKGIIIPSVC